MAGRLLFWLCAIAALLCFVFVVRPSSGIWRVAFDVRNKAHVASVACATALAAVLMVPLAHVSNQQAWLQNPTFDESIQHVQDGNQYDYLADSIIAGRASLDLPVSDILLGMDNPYDTAERSQLNSQAHDAIYWDYAYYQGSYYCYFGVLPCLMLFVPAKAIFGIDLPTDIAVLVFAVLVVCAAPILLRAAVRAFGLKPSFGATMASLLGMWICSGVTEQVFLPRIYSVPILSAMFFAMLGLAFWLRAKTHKRARGEGFDALGVAFLAAGGASIAATLACRPQFVLVAFLAFPIFWSEIKQRLFFSARGLVNTAAVVLPFIVVAVPVCAYNFVRFGSFFDFGASYNLTGADMTSYVFSLKMMLVRMAEYLALPPIASDAFPFMLAANEAHLPAVLWTNEPFYGGLIELLPFAVAWIACIAPSVRKSVAGKGCLGFAVCSVVVGLAILAFDCVVSGVTMRYFGDFAWLFCIASAIVLLGMPCEGDARRKGGWVARWVGPLSAYAVAVSLVAYSLTFFGTARIGALAFTDPDVFSFVASCFLQ